MFARCLPHASLDADAELAETVWGLASSRKDGDVFQRVGYFIGNIASPGLEVQHNAS